MTADRLVALGARDDLLWLVAHWPDLRNALRPGGGNALNGMPPGGNESAIPIDVHVSDLMREIEEAARFYGQILIEEAPPMHGCNDACYLETPPVPVEDCPDRQDAITTSFMPGLLEDVAHRYWHFLEDDTDIEVYFERKEGKGEWLKFTDAAHEMRRKVTNILSRPAPPVYVGPCQTNECVGELYLGEGREGGACKECGNPFTLVEQRAYLDRELEARLMTRREIVVALKILGHDVKKETLDKWVQRGRLVEAEDGLFRLADAMALMERKGGVA